jgi:hypothetical protein
MVSHYQNFLKIAVNDSTEGLLQVRTEALLEYINIVASALKPDLYPGIYATIARVASNFKDYNSTNFNNVIQLLSARDQKTIDASRAVNKDLFTYVRIRNGTPGCYVLRKGAGGDAAMTIGVVHKDYAEAKSTDTFDRGQLIFKGTQRDLKSQLDNPYGNNYYHVYGPFSRVFIRQPEETTPPITEHREIVSHMAPVVEAITNGRNACVILTGPSGSGKSSLGIYLRYEENGEIKEATGILPLLCMESAIVARYQNLVVDISEIIRKPLPSQADECVEVSSLPDDVNGLGLPNIYRKQAYSNQRFKWDGQYWTRILDNSWIPGTDLPNYNPFVSETLGSGLDPQAEKVSDRPLQPGYKLEEFLDFLLTHMRRTQGTTNNPQSSRSHLIVFIRFTGNEPQPSDPHLVMCDLAGIENRFLCEERSVQEDFVNITNMKKLVYKPYLDSVMKNNLDRIKQATGIDASAADVSAIKSFEYKAVKVGKEFKNGYNINFDNDNPNGSTSCPDNENIIAEDEIDDMLCAYHVIKSCLYTVVNSKTTTDSSSGRPTPKIEIGTTPYLAWLPPPNFDSGACGSILKSTVGGNETRTVVRGPSKKTAFTPKSHNIKPVPPGINSVRDELAQNSNQQMVARQTADRIITDRWDDMFKGVLKPYKRFIILLARMGQKPGDRNSTLPAKLLHSLLTAGTTDFRKAVIASIGDTTRQNIVVSNSNKIDRLAKTLYELKEAIQQYKKIEEQCVDRRNEGAYINKSIVMLKDFIKSIMFQRNRQPELYSACAAIADNIFARDIMVEALDTSINQSSIQGKIANRLTQVRTGTDERSAGVDLVTQQAILKDLMLVVFNVVRVYENREDIPVDPGTRVYPPPKGYIETTELALELLRVRSRGIAFDSTHSIVDANAVIVKDNTVQQKLLDYSWSVRDYAWQLILERLENHSITCKNDDLIKRINKLRTDSSSKTYDKSELAEYIIRVQKVINDIQIGNDQTFLGSFEFIDSVAKFGMTKNLCVLPEVIPDDNSEYKALYSGVGLQFDGLNKKISEDIIQNDLRKNIDEQ